MRNDFERQVRGQCLARTLRAVARSRREAGRRGACERGAPPGAQRGEGASRGDGPSEPRRGPLPWELGAVATAQAPLPARAGGPERVLVTRSRGQCS